ncbi:MAG: uroporphyrinogen-III synthase [Chloroflexia bacterium]|nr:uroporphyrinogen-III synthase [Chloroflexia bacterium]
MKTIISTQLPDQFKKLETLFNNQVELLNMPLIEIVPMQASVDLLNEIKTVTSHNWLIFTSMRGIQCFFSLFDKTHLKRTDLQKLRIACIGNSTNEELKKYGFTADYINQGNTSKEFSKHLIEEVLSPEDKVFLPLAEKANDYLPTQLEGYCKAKRVNVYQTNRIKKIDNGLLQRIKGQLYDLIIFTSPSAIENFINLTDFNPATDELRIASIGATTSEAIEKFGFSSTLTASKSDLKTLSKEILEYLKE